MMPTDPPRLGPYRPERILGKGASATVYLAQDERDARWVAIKVLTPGWEPSGVDREEAHLRFAQEAAIVQRSSSSAAVDAGRARSNNEDSVARGPWPGAQQQ
jgi:serine/threonine protein kinase